MDAVFTRRLLHWNITENIREMPWKGIKDPYKIWLSEVILQQTRVEQGWDYYEKFILKYPKIQDLANANDSEVYKLWEGLGYYSRCKNLLVTARKIVSDYQGIFPANYEKLLQLNGIGPYTAAAIASFAFNLPHAVLDGNVYRVLARYFSIAIPIDTTAGKKHFQNLADRLLSKKDPAAFNQAMMDLGASICKPFSAECSICPLQTECRSYKNALVHHYPIKEKRLTKKKRNFSFFVFQYRGKMYIRKRTEKDIWENLYEFYLVESNDAMHWNQTSILDFLKSQLGIQFANLKFSTNFFKQQLTHQQIQAQFIQVELTKMPSSLLKQNWQDIKKIKEFPFPKIINEWLANHFN